MNQWKSVGKTLVKAVFGKMGHSERIGSNVAKNIVGNKDQKIFEAGVGYWG